MLLTSKNAVIHGAGGAIGGAVARAFAREGAKVFLAGDNRPPIDAVAMEIAKTGGVAETAQVDALDGQAVKQHANSIIEKARAEGKPLDRFQADLAKETHDGAVDLQIPTRCDAGVGAGAGARRAIAPTLGQAMVRSERALATWRRLHVNVAL